MTRAVNVASSTNLALVTPTITGATITVASTAAPAFSAFLPSNQTITSNITTIVAFSSESFDTGSRFNNTGSTVGGIPAYAFLPNVAGYYQFNVTINLEAGVATTRALININKNGNASKRVSDQTPNPLNSTDGSGLIYLNGTSDYVQVSAYITATTATMSGDADGLFTYFNGFLARSA